MFSAFPQINAWSAPCLLFSYRHSKWWLAATSEVLCCVILPTRSHKSLKSPHKEEKVRKGEWKHNSFTGHISLYWMILGMLRSFAVQLAYMIWSVTAIPFQKVICIPSCLLSGARKFLTAVLWHVILPESKTLLCIRQNSKPQLMYPGIRVSGTFVCCAALCPACSLCVVERNPSQPKHWQQLVNHSMGFSAC